VVTCVFFLDCAGTSCTHERKKEGQALAQSKSATLLATGTV
jgi:hypothetical protein